jgi:hypothetical protein
MKTDDRDERLGTILNDAVRDIDVSSREAPVAQIRVVGRAGRVVAAVAAAAVFLGAGAFAAAQFGRDTPPGTDGSDSVIEGSLATDDWQLERPSDWFTAPFDGCGTAFARGLIVSNVGFEFLNPEGQIPSCNERIVFAGFPSDGVAIDLEPQGIIPVLSPVPPPDTPFPVRPGQLAQTSGIRGGPDHYMGGVVIGGESAAIIRLWVGADASAGDIEEAYRILGSMRVEGGDRWIEEEVEFRGWPVGKETTVRVNMSRPEDWRAEAYKRPGVIDAPNPILVLSSPLTDDGAQRACGPSAFFRPGSAPRVSSSGVAIAISDASESWSYPKLGSRWAPLDPESATTDKIVECQGDGTVRWLQWGFEIDRRRILVDVLFGTAVEDDVARLTWATLDTLRFPGTAQPEEPATLPPPVRDDYRSEFVSDERGFRFWPRSGRAESGVVYRFEVPHCGLDWLVDFDGSFWEPVYAMPDSKPDYAINSDIGTITLIGPDDARYVSSTDEQISLFRVDGPIVRQLCD